jgi:hypothetical protein
MEEGGKGPRKGANLGMREHCMEVSQALKTFLKFYTSHFKLSIHAQDATVDHGS